MCLASRSRAATAIATTVLRHYAFLEESLHEVQDASTSVLKLKLALFKAIQALAKSLLTKALKIDLQSQLVMAIAVSMHPQRPPEGCSNQLLMTFLKHSLISSSSRGHSEGERKVLGSRAQPVDLELRDKCKESSLKILKYMTAMSPSANHNLQCLEVRCLKMYVGDITQLISFLKQTLEGTSF